KEDLEKRLARRLRLAPPTPLSAPAAARDLIDRLPAGVAFVDFLRYTHIELDPDRPGRKGERSTPRYLAFVLRQRRPAVPVELGTAQEVDGAWAAWRKALAANHPEERAAAAAFARLVWEPLRPHLPAGLHALYLAPDGRLTEVPWAALPGRRPGSVVLEDT